MMSELDERKKKRKKRKKAGSESSKESSLRDWFKRKGAKGKKGGWVDCNAPDGKGGYKSCGRSSGEKRKKYPACRPTPGACKERGRGKSWGKKGSKKKRNESMQMTTEEIRIMIVEELQNVLDEKKGKRRVRKKKAKKKAKRDACYHKVKARYDVWPSAYASGALTKCRKVGAANWGNKSKKNESLNEEFSKEEIDKILSTFEKEGGALGLDPLLKAFPDMTKKDIIDQLKKMKNIKKHKDGDYIDSDGLSEEYINENEMSDSDKKELKKIRDELKIAVKMHKSQADRIGDMVNEEQLEEAEYRGRKVKLNKPMRGDVKKFKVFVKDPKTGNVKKVNFGDPNMRIKKSNPKRRKSFRARHNCDNPGPKTKARYWSCRKW